MVLILHLSFIYNVGEGEKKSRDLDLRFLTTCANHLIAEVCLKSYCLPEVRYLMYRCSSAPL